MRRIAAIAAAAVLAAGCGDGDAEETPTVGPCPEGTPFVRARDVVGPPPAGYQLVAGDKSALDDLAASLRQEVGRAWRGHDAKVLVPRRAAEGTAVVVVNALAETGDDFLRTRREAERRAGLTGEDIQIGDETGRLNRAVDGAWVAFAPVGECSAVMLVSNRRRLLEHTASLIRGS
jgi:hypothetical protein